MTGRCIKSIKEFEKKYFPNDYEERLNEEMPPEKIGVVWAKDTINKLKKNLKIFA